MSVTIFKSKNVVINGEVKPACVVVNQDGKIEGIHNYSAYSQESGTETTFQLHDFGDLVISPGIVDSHVHINEPGRTHWEGFVTATKAAAAGGVTTVVDMPLNSIPPTTTTENLEVKLNAARGNVFVDTAFWGGVIPGNQLELRTLLEKGVKGFKCFLCPSGVDEFPYVKREDLELALEQLQNTNGTLLFHAEVECDQEEKTVQSNSASHSSCYESFLTSRPGQMEVNAIRMVIELTDKYRVPTHIVHLSSADALPLIVQAKKDGIPITVETCPHYLTIDAEEVPLKATQFKCCPPIRSKENQDRLWKGVVKNDIDMIVSDHSPAPQDLKCTDSGDFMQAWGGISSLQLALPLIWTYGREKGLSLIDLSRLLSANTAKLARLDNRKGSIAVGMDADFVIWDPNETFTVTRDMLQFRHKLSPYLGRTLHGRVFKTILRGQSIYCDEDSFSFDKPQGTLLL